MYIKIATENLKQTRNRKKCCVLYAVTTRYNVTVCSPQFVAVNPDNIQ
jgi:hypothetical protein